MISKYKSSDLMKVVQRENEPPHCDDTMHIEMQACTEGVAHAKWFVDERFMNGVGVVMGGFVTSAADITMAYAIASKLTDEQSFASITLQSTFHRPVFQGEVEVTAKVERIGSKVAYLVAELNQNDKLVANVTSSVMILEQ
ncbi:PaaI family thioesterase [Alkalihalobacterium bogoriense]|uniref:PaaI family thioesterase n=1 Tax=Alkalihalobacterium bogoriense TaxID=246272 RepID=UPI00047E9C2F|nr:PaaI family thioesterase [Alkalihalobacterium bogoriense]